MKNDTERPAKWRPVYHVYNGEKRHSRTVDGFVVSEPSKHGKVRFRFWDDKTQQLRIKSVDESNIVYE